MKSWRLISSRVLSAAFSAAILAALWLSACRPSQGMLPATTRTLQVQAAQTLTVAAPARATSSQAGPTTPTAVLAFSEPEATPLPLLPTVTPLPEPLRFVFPTPPAAPVSAWRPPLYPVPWAPTPFDHFYFARPIAADEINWPRQDYRYGGDFFADTIHTGVDIPAVLRTEVLAAGPGKVVWSGYGLYRGGEDITDPYGIAVAILHDFGYQNQKLYTLYGHLDEAVVVSGQWVDTGQLIGYVGETGKVTGPHLHFEVRLGDNSFYTTRNPELWIVPPEGWGVLAGRVMDTDGRLVEKLPVILTAIQTEQNWHARTYGAGAVKSDEYYNENLVIGDLPAGRYRIRLSYAGVSLTQEITIYPGRVSYFEFYGKTGFKIGLPDIPGANFTPEP